MSSPSSKSRRAERRRRRRALFRTFWFGLAVGLLWAGLGQATADVKLIRSLFGF